MSSQHYFLNHQRFIFGAYDRPSSRKPKKNGGSKDQQLFEAGSVVRETGIYEVIHHYGHRTPHEVLMLRDDIFPYCDQCRDQVRFKLIRTATYVFDDPDFVEES